MPRVYGRNLFAPREVTFRSFDDGLEEEEEDSMIQRSLKNFRDVEESGLPEQVGKEVLQVAKEVFERAKQTASVQARQVVQETTTVQEISEQTTTTTVLLAKQTDAAPESAELQQLREEVKSLRGVESDLAERTEEAKKLKHEKTTLERDFRALRVKAEELEAEVERLQEENGRLQVSQNRLRGMTDQNLEKVEQLEQLFAVKKPAQTPSYGQLRNNVRDIFEFSYQ